MCVARKIGGKGGSDQTSTKAAHVLFLPSSVLVYVVQPILFDLEKIVSDWPNSAEGRYTRICWVVLGGAVRYVR